MLTKHFNKSNIIQTFPHSNGLTSSINILTVYSNDIRKKKKKYFEIQAEAFYGLHALNSALQFKMFEKNFLIECADQLQINESRLYIDNDNIESNVYSNISGNFKVDMLDREKRSLTSWNVYFI